MIITKTPYRISFFGGGTDHPAWFRENGGKVLATTFDKYCYISLRSLPPFFDHKYRIVYSAIESVKKIEDIQHPAVREVLKYFNLSKGMEIHHDGDLPARSGLGSSSSFTVGLLNALYAFDSKFRSPHDLAKTAIHIEQDLIGEFVGSQDQISASYGGFNKIEFYKNNTFSVEPMIVSESRKQDLSDNLMLFFTGISRFSSEIAQSQLLNMNNCSSQMGELQDMVDEGVSILADSKTPLENFGILLGRSWKTKMSLSIKITNSEINDIYNSAIKAGATGGKILGAGGGGFLLFYVKTEYQEKVKDALASLTHVPFEFENTGSKVVLHQPNGF